MNAIITVAPPSPPPGQVTVYGIANIVLAGQLAVASSRGSSACNYAYDNGTLNSPVNLGFNLSGLAGQAIQFTNVTGMVSLAGGIPDTLPDGNLSNMDTTTSEFGLSSVTGPSGALVGVFLNDLIPSGTAPPALDFSTQANRDILVLSPVLRQVFYIGSGGTSLGSTKGFVVPQGATRLFVGVLEQASCNANNTGWFSVGVPILPPPPLQITEFSWSGDAFSLNVVATAGKSYTLEYKDSLSELTWKPIMTVSCGGCLLTLTDPSATMPQRFYRVRVD
ncbi:MAG: hypothetical protein HY298_08550 [Verrucomicrobia bacterium]|nr:hypothetical protein [Verrucomicrobiota bacterium]